MFSIAAMFPDYKIWLQDVTQSYIKGHYLQHDVYVKPVEHFNLSKDTYLKLLKLLYQLQK